MYRYTQQQCCHFCKILCPKEIWVYRGCKIPSKEHKGSTISRNFADWRAILIRHNRAARLNTGLSLSPTTSISTPLLLSPLSATADLPLHYRLDKHLPLVSESHSSRATLRFRSWPCGEATAIWRKKRRRERKKKASLLG